MFLSTVVDLSRRVSEMLCPIFSPTNFTFLIVVKLHLNA